MAILSSKLLSNQIFAGFANISRTEKMKYFIWVHVRCNANMECQLQTLAYVQAFKVEIG